MIQESILDIVRKMEDEDEQGGTKISKYVTYSQRETIEKTDAYVNSKHISGETDSMGRDKPFFNIVTAAINIWYRATDIDRKNIKIRATKTTDYILAFVMTLKLNEWMRKSNFGVFLNNWGRTLAKQGSAISKFVVKDVELIAEVMPWNRMIVDPVDFENNVKIEKIWLTPAQLRERTEYDQKMVEDLIDARETRETSDGQDIDNQSEYVEIFEVHGLLPLYYITELEADEKTYKQQMHVVSYIGKTDGEGDKFDDYTLFKGIEKKDPLSIAHLLKEDGRTVSIGSVENLFEGQWMVNHSVKSIKDQLDLASKLIYQTSDSNFVGQNALNSIENGQILVHAVNQPLTQVNNQSHDITSLQAFGQQWEINGNKINGIAESMITQAKSGTAWRQTQAELQEAHSLFELMTENKGLAIEEMLREYVIPYLKTQMDTSEEISAILESHNIHKIDTMYAPAEATRRVNKMITDDILNKTPENIIEGDLFSKEQQVEQLGSEQEAIQNTLNTFGNQRFIKPSDVPNKTWKDALKDFEWDVEVDITGENKDTQAMLTTLTTVFQTIAGRQGQPMTDEEKIVFNKILSMTGALSPLEIPETKSGQPVPQAQPTQGQELNQLTK